MPLCEAAADRSAHPPDDRTWQQADLFSVIESAVGEIDDRHGEELAPLLA